MLLRRGLTAETLESRKLLTSTLMSQCADVTVDANEPAQTLGTSTSNLSDNWFDSSNELGPVFGQRQVDERVGVADPIDFYRFEMSDAGSVQLDVWHESRRMFVYLFGSDRQILDLSVSRGLSSDVVHAELDSGSYFVAVGGWGLLDAPYRLSIQTDLQPPAPPDGAGNSIRDARVIGSLQERQTFDDAVGGVDAADVYRFTLERSGQVDIQLRQIRADVDIYLLDALGQTIARSVRSSILPEQLKGRLRSGTYHLAVLPYQTAQSDYRLLLEAELDSPPRPDVPVVPPVTESPRPTQPPVATPDAEAPGGNEPFPNVANYGGLNDWNLNAVNAPESWAQGYTGQGTVVAVVDTGVDRRHHDLLDNIWRNADEVFGDGIDNDRNGYVDDYYGWNFSRNNNNTLDGNGHGTHVAGTIASSRNRTGATGVAYDAEIMPVAVLDADGSGSDNSVARGIRYAVDNGADIINLSLGGGYSSTIFSALRYASQNDVFVVIASGNEGAAVPSYPARFSRDLNNVISVGAFDRNYRTAGFSNDVGNSGAIQIDAPGVGVYSTLPNDRYGYLSGTSMAAPHVAGVAALALSANPDLTSSQLKQMLSQGANQSIIGTDSLGGVNSAVSVAKAANTSRAAAATAQAAAINGSRGTSIASAGFSHSEQIDDIVDDIARALYDAEQTVDESTNSRFALTDDNSTGLHSRMVHLDEHDIGLASDERLHSVPLIDSDASGDHQADEVQEILGHGGLDIANNV